jgi:hypothetical protein
MRIENLSKEIDTKAMTAVRGGSTGAQNVPTFNQGNWLSQTYNVHSDAPVQILGDMSGSNDASAPNYQLPGSFVFVGFPRQAD